MTSAAETPVEDQALALLSWLITTYGPQAIMATFGVVAGGPGGAIVEAGTELIADLIGAIRLRMDDEKIRAILDAQYVAADAVVDAVETARFGPKK